MNRRSVLKAGLASSLLPLIGFNGIAKALDFESKVKLTAIVSDTRFAASNSFGSHAKTLGVPLLVSNGDITKVWLKHLDPIWKQGSAFVMGLTTQEQLFCLERLAWDRGMKVLMRIEHNAVGEGRIAHSIIAPPRLIEKTTLAVQNEHFWPTDLGVLLSSCSSSLLSGSCFSRQVMSKGCLNEQLVTWVIAPSTRSA
ncbi:MULTISPECIES: hypothetical protein [unclassified Pseudomonas]|uniref:hypothetical protein n=1 Tax=unclassified Pseudomonas TaxID=196821 RepID=UPI00087F8AB1|nr:MULTISPECIES: hypothetical protein [unclassified Pseudomonas]SCZ05983.1 hypothetical protein SAMN03159391_04946 [Pseudomonas sp. NFACC37-1]SFO82325.1 hypothetical protein SAMN03159304_05201 [Pseudomonas sp. NFACC24-1]